MISKVKYIEDVNKRFQDNVKEILLKQIDLFY